MGTARIIANLGQPYANNSARYTIEIDVGSDKKAEALAKLNTRLNENQAQIDEVMLQLVAIDAQQDALRLALQSAEAAWIAAAQAGADPSPDEMNQARRRLADFVVANAPTRIRFKALQIERKRLLRDVATWNSFQPIQQRNAWTPQFPENVEGLAIGSDVQTFEVNGEPGLLLISEAPGSVLVPGPGKLLAREVMSPEQAFFNAAILPGWQRFKPTHRSGIVEACYFDIGRLRVVLDDAASSAIGLDINQPPGVIEFAETTGPVDAYLPGDRVLVRFPAQSWDRAIVMGWLDGPKRYPVTWTLGVSAFTHDGFGQVITQSLSATQNAVLLSAARPSQRLTRLNPESSFPLTSLAPRAVCRQEPASGFVTSYAFRIAENPTVTNFSHSIAYTFFQLEPDGTPVVGARYQGFVTPQTLPDIGPWTAQLEPVIFYAGSDPFKDPPYGYTQDGIEYLQSARTGITLTGTGATQDEAVTNALNNGFSFTIKAIFGDGEEADLTLTGYFVDGVANTQFFRISSVTPEFLPLAS